MATWAEFLGSRQISGFHSEASGVHDVATLRHWCALEAKSFFGRLYGADRLCQGCWNHSTISVVARSDLTSCVRASCAGPCGRIGRKPKPRPTCRRCRRSAFQLCGRQCKGLQADMRKPQSLSRSDTAQDAKRDFGCTAHNQGDLKQLYITF